MPEPHARSKQQRQHEQREDAVRMAATRVKGEVGAPEAGHDVDVGKVRADQQRGGGMARAMLETGLCQRGAEEGVGYRVHVAAPV